MTCPVPNTTQLGLHLLSEHRLGNAHLLTFEEQRDIHTHEHAGPGTLRNHPPAFRNWSLTKIRETLIGMGESTPYGVTKDATPSLPARLVREFHEKFDLPIGDLSHEVNAFRAKLISEESGEVAEAIQLLNGVLAAVDRAAMPARLVDTMISDARAVLAKELADVVVAVYGTAVTAGIDLDEAVRRVHASNLSKVGRDGRPILDADGKVQKGPNYRSPDMRPSVRPL
jgi:predicted HAD superfamily Cof-like phosphohydrolase